MQAERKGKAELANVPAEIPTARVRKKHNFGWNEKTVSVHKDPSLSSAFITRPPPRVLPIPCFYILKLSYSRVLQLAVHQNMAPLL